MHEKVLTKAARQLLAALADTGGPALKGWTLAGGTGLALHLGHRVSAAFDFFRTTAFDREPLHVVVRGLGAYETLQEDPHTLTVLSRGVKLSFFRVPDPFIFPSVPYSFFRVADVQDIALMKLVAISGRGSRKDFVDLYAMLRRGVRLETCFADLPRKYPAGRANRYHILKSLTYFADAETEPMPRMLEPCPWRECKAFLIREARALILP